MIPIPLFLLFLLFLASAGGVYANKCFADRDELKAAVDQYIDVENCTISIDGCAVGQTYGWPIGTWCVGNITDMSFLFTDKENFNEDLSGWDVSSVSYMYRMFSGSGFNGDISSWDVSSVIDMDGIFLNSAFNSDISLWNVSSVRDMGGMFYGSVFNSDISHWDVSSVVKMDSMFKNSAFNSDISQWDVSSVVTMDSMFMNSAFNSDISLWNVSSVRDMGGMFFDATSFNQDLCAWRDKFPYDNAYFIFEYSGCTFQDTPQWNPQLGQRGPFCASACGISDSPSLSPTKTSTPTISPPPTWPKSNCCAWEYELKYVVGEICTDAGVSSPCYRYCPSSAPFNGLSSFLVGGKQWVVCCKEVYTEEYYKETANARDLPYCGSPEHLGIAPPTTPEPTIAPTQLVSTPSPLTTTTSSPSTTSLGSIIDWPTEEEPCPEEAAAVQACMPVDSNNLDSYLECSLCGVEAMGDELMSFDVDEYCEKWTSCISQKCPEDCKDPMNDYQKCSSMGVLDCKVGSVSSTEEPKEEETTDVKNDEEDEAEAEAAEKSASNYSKKSAVVSISVTKVLLAVGAMFM